MGQWDSILWDIWVSVGWHSVGHLGVQFVVVTRKKKKNSTKVNWQELTFSTKVNWQELTFCSSRPEMELLDQTYFQQDKRWGH